MSVPPAFDPTPIDDISHALMALIRSNPTLNLQADHELRDLMQRYTNPGGFSPAHSARGADARADDSFKEFSYRTCAAWRDICSRFGPGLTHSELLCVAEVVAYNLNLTVDREAKRRKSCLVRWFDANLAQINPFLSRLRLLDVNGIPIQKLTV
jgi:hypothetical protein